MIGGVSLRRGLVVLQFAIAHILIIGMILVVSQMNFFRNASLGFTKAAIINGPYDQRQYQPDQTGFFA